LTRNYIPEAQARLHEAERAIPEYAALHDLPRIKPAAARFSAS
jgi:hypothetical protein